MRQWYIDAHAAIIADIGTRNAEWHYPVAIVIDVATPDRRHRDLDNVLKAVLDALVRAKVLVNDDMTHVHCITVRWSGVDAEGHGHVIVTITEPS